VYHPTDEDQVMAVFERAKRERRRVVIRGGGHSFDGQAVHDLDTGQHLVLGTGAFLPDLIQFNPAAKTVRLGAGVPWRGVVRASLERSVAKRQPILLPGSMQTGGAATVGGTLAGDCLSRFSGVAGKESAWIESLRLLTPKGERLDVSRARHPDLFDAVVGGHGYIGFVTDATYKLVEHEAGSIAHTDITTHTTFKSLIDTQKTLIDNASASSELMGVSSAWYPSVPGVAAPIKGGVFASTFRPPSNPPLPGFLLYQDLDSVGRYWTEVLARLELANFAIHEILFHAAKETPEGFDNDIEEFLFFMDGNTHAKHEFERLHPGLSFQIVQQTYVVPVDVAERFVKRCMTNVFQNRNTHPTECDMLFVMKDQCLMSGNYGLDGFAITFAFEPPGGAACPPGVIPKVLRALSVECLAAGGRLHLVKNLHVDPVVFRKMFSNRGNQIEQFEVIKREHDPCLLLQNRFSDTFFQFSGRRTRAV